MSLEYRNGCNNETQPSPAPTVVPCPPPFWKMLTKDLLVAIVSVSILGFFLALIPILTFAGAVGVFAEIGKKAEKKSPIVEHVIDGSEDADEKIVVLPIEGEIESDSAVGDGFWNEALKDVLEDENVKALVLRIDSPGGTVSGSAYYHRLVRKIKEERQIPVVVSMGDLTASGGYYISSAADELVAEPSTWTGSIGVISPQINIAALCNNLGVRSSAITSGPMKGMGNMMKEPTEEELAVWQALIDDSYEQFLSVVREGRPWFTAAEIEDEEERAKVAAERDQQLRKIADGRIYSANQALENHLIDRIGYLDDAIDVALERAGVTKDDVCVVVYTEEETLMSALGLKAKTDAEPMGRVSKAIDSLAAPKAYYLCPNALPL